MSTLTPVEQATIRLLGAIAGGLDALEDSPRYKKFLVQRADDVATALGFVNMDELIDFAKTSTNEDSK